MSELVTLVDSEELTNLAKYSTLHTQVLTLWMDVNHLTLSQLSPHSSTSQLHRLSSFSV